jgi:hypothetical protein
MKNHTRTLVIAASAAFLIAACGKKDGSSGKKPPKPGDGTPIATEFVKMTGEGKKLAAKIKVHNYVDKKITRAVFTLRYLDGAGKELKTWPWSVAQQAVVKANGSATHTMGVFVPEATKKVEAVPRRVTFGDGTKWQAGAKATPDKAAAKPAGTTDKK